MLKSNIFDELMTIHSSFDELLNRIFKSDDRFGVVPSRESRWMPPAESFLDKDKFAVRVFLPGVEEKNVNLSLVDDVVVVEGERTPSATQDLQVFFNDYPYGKFERRFVLPENILVDKEKCSARFANGVLEITMPVIVQHLHKRQIPIASTTEAARQIANA
jgi:HSP20 family protein